MNKIGNKIKQLRLDHSMTQQQLADKLVVTNKTISKWETGRNLPDIEMIGKIADVFDVSADELLTNKKSMRLKPKRLLTLLFIILLIFTFMMFQAESYDQHISIVAYVFVDVIVLLTACIVSCFISVNKNWLKVLRYIVYGLLVIYNVVMLSVLFPSNGVGIFIGINGSYDIYLYSILCGIIIGI